MLAFSLQEVRASKTPEAAVALSPRLSLSLQKASCPEPITAGSNKELGGYKLLS